MLKKVSKDAIKELRKARYVKKDDDKNVTSEDVNVGDVSTVGYNSDTENLQTTPVMSSSQQQTKKIIKKYKDLKRKKKYTGYKNSRKSKDDDTIFLKQIPLHPR